MTLWLSASSLSYFIVEDLKSEGTGDLSSPTDRCSWCLHKLRGQVDSIPDKAYWVFAECSSPGDLQILKSPEQLDTIYKK